MNNKVFDIWDERLSDKIDLYKSMAANDPDRQKLAAEITKESALLEKLETDHKKVNLESRKFNKQLRDEQEEKRQAFDEKVRQTKLEEERSKLEKDRFEFDKQEASRNRKDKIIDTSVRILEIALPVFVYGWLAVASLRLTYKDEGHLPSDFKDFVKNIVHR